MDHEQRMYQALQLAETAAAADEVPIGALLVRDELLMGEGYNQNISNCDPTAHAEIVALREACTFLGNYRLPPESILYVTLEPCLMCYTALVHARLGTLVYGASDPKAGYTRFLPPEKVAEYNHQIQVIPGVLETECADAIRTFFREKRERGKRKWMRHSNDN